MKKVTEQIEETLQADGYTITLITFESKNE